MNAQYDAIIVGGRCAGAGLGAWLARSGARVAVLEAGRLGTDQVLSTHTVHPSGMDLLDDLGVADAIFEKTPPLTRLRFEIDGQAADIEPLPRRAACPRRYRLDRLIQDAAAAAGAEICEQTRVEDLLRDGDTVVGVRATHNGKHVELRAPITVGADGRHSTVARLAGAEEYLGYDWPRGMYWAYWDPPADWHGPGYPYDLLIRFNGGDRRVIFPTDDGQLLLGTLPLVDQAKSWRSHLDERYLADLRSDPVFAPLTEGKMASKIIGTVSERFFFRRAAGPGWALVGDAGHYKDPIVGWGISEALYQAKHLAVAIRDGSEAAFQRYWRQRDVDSLPRFRIAEDRGMPGRINPVVSFAISRMKNRPDLRQRMFQEVEFDANPYELLPVPTVARWVVGAALRGKPGYIRHFLAQGRRAMRVQKEVAAARKKLDAIAPTSGGRVRR